MTRLPLAALLATTLLAAPLATQDPDLEFSQVEMIPVSMLRLGDAALIAPGHFVDLGIELGQPAMIEHDGKQAQVLLYKIERDEASITLRKELRDALGVMPGEARVTLRLITREESTVEPPDVGVRVEFLPGDPAKWPGVALAAPHGDSDTDSWRVAEGLAKDFGIPTTILYRSRMTFLGRWIDGNRPTQRVPQTLYGIEPDRSWTKEAEAVYEDYKASVLGSNTMLGRLPGEVPLAFYFDMHGHGLTVRGEDGRSISRRVSECMARGFTRDEVRWLKENLDACLKKHYEGEPPPTVWGNLPEDREYEIQGIPATFTYTGLGGRVFGMINSEHADRAIHIEMHGSMRTNAENRAATIKALGEFVGLVHERFNAPPRDHELRWVPVPAVEFEMGGDLEDITSTAMDRRRVRLSPFEIGRTEVTNAQYARFLDEALAAGDARVEGADVVRASDGALLCRMFPGVAHSGLVFTDGAFHVLPGRAMHPVVHVTHEGASAFASSVGGRLPTEAEWEVAAGWDPQAATVTAWSEADDPEYRALWPGNYMHSDWRENHAPAGTTTVEVGSVPGAASALGAVDMIGNVWEWTADWYGRMPAEEEVVVDPQGPESGTMRTIRGGAWDTEPHVSTVRSRLGVGPHATLPTVGFRVARDVQEGQ